MRLEEGLFMKEKKNRGTELEKEEKVSAETPRGKPVFIYYYFMLCISIFFLLLLFLLFLFW